MNSAELNRQVRRWADSKAVPAAVLARWLALDERSREHLLEVALTLKMRTGQLIATFGLLEEVAVRECQTVAEILAYPLLGRVLTSPGSGPGRARALLEELRGLRYPRLKRTLNVLTQEVAALGLPSGVKIALPRDLASNEVRVEIAAHGRAEMEQLLGWLRAKSSDLVRLSAMIGDPDGMLEIE